MGMEVRMGRTFRNLPGSRMGRETVASIPEIQSFSLNVNIRFGLLNVVFRILNLGLLIILNDLQFMLDFELQMSSFIRLTA